MVDTSSPNVPALGFVMFGSGLACVIRTVQLNRQRNSRKEFLDFMTGCKCATHAIL